MKMRWSWVAVAPLIWLACGVVWLAGFLVGIPMTLVACLARAYEWAPSGGDRNEGYWFYTWHVMRHWSTWDNGACAAWYVKSSGERVILRLPGWGWLGRFAGRVLYTRRWDNAKRPLWLNLWIYSGWRNAFGGNPFNLVVPPRWIAYRSDDGSGVRLSTRFVVDKARNECKRVYWNITQYGWRVGVHVLFPFHRKPGSNNSHFEIRHGWKLYPDVQHPSTMVFSLWDTGPRFR